MDNQKRDTGRPLLLLFAVAAALAAYYAQVRHVPILEDVLYGGAHYLNQWLPALRLLHVPFEFIGAAIDGLVSLILGAVILALFQPSSKLESKMKESQRRRDFPRLRAR
jgi:hypothetical protein